MFDQNFVFSVVAFCSHAAISLWCLLFFQFFGSAFLSGFPNRLVVQSRPRCLLESSLHFSWFCYFVVLASVILTLIFCFLI